MIALSQPYILTTRGQQSSLYGKIHLDYAAILAALAGPYKFGWEEICINMASRGISHTCESFISRPSLGIGVLTSFAWYCCTRCLLSRIVVPAHTILLGHHRRINLAVGNNVFHEFFQDCCPLIFLLLELLCRHPIPSSSHNHLKLEKSGRYKNKC